MKEGEISAINLTMFLFHYIYILRAMMMIMIVILDLIRTEQNWCLGCNFFPYLVHFVLYFFLFKGE